MASSGTLSDRVAMCVLAAGDLLAASIERLAHRSLQPRARLSSAGSIGDFTFLFSLSPSH